jgi:DNA ligase-1
MSLFDFECSKCTVPYLDRLHKAHEIIDRGNKHSPLKAAHTWVAATPARVNQIYADLIDQGLEGLILKSPKHLYTFKRSADWVKLKEIKTADLQCVDYVQGTGKYQGMIGALACEGLVEGQHVTVNVGSGLTDEDRQHHPSDFIARTIEVKYNSIIQDSITKEWSLFLPRFVMVRFDK